MLSIDGVENLLQVSFFLAVGLTIVLLASNLKENKKKIERLSQQLAEENAEQLRMALSAAQMGMWDWNIATGKIKWSPEHEQLFGLTPGTFDGRYETFDRFIHPDDRESLDRSLKQALQTHNIYQHEYRIIWPDGSIHWIEARGHSICDAAGQPLRMTGTVINIDDRKRGEAERKQAEVLLHQQWEQQRTIVEISQRIRKSLNLAEILQTTVDEVRQLLQTSRVIIFQFAPNWSGTVVVESVGSEWTAILSTQIYDPCLGEKYVEPFLQGLVTAKSDIYTPEIDPCYVELLANFQVKANLVVPILNGKELWGLLISHHCGEPRQWQPSEIELMQQVVTQVAIAIQQAELVEKLQIELQQRRQTEAALRDSEQKFRQLAENIEDVFFLYTADYSQLLYINSAYENIWQRTCESVYQNPFSFLDSIHPMDRDRLIPAMDRLLNGEANLEEEYRIIRPDGSIRWIYDRGFFVYNEAGEPYRIAGLSSDITERKLAEIALHELNAELEQRIVERTAELTQTNSLLQQELYQRQRIEQALRQSEAQFQNLVANVPGAIYRLVQSPDNSVWFEYISPAIEEMYEVEVEQILENAAFVVNPIHLEDLKEHQAAISRSRENLEPFDHEWRITTPSGKLKWLHGRSIPERRDNGETVWYGIVQDISERKKIEERLQQTLQQLSFHIENTPLATIIWDSQFRVHQWSKQAEAIFGWTSEEVFGKMMYDWQFIFEDDREIVNLKAQELLSGKSVVCINRNYRKDGKVIDIEWYSSTLLDELGNLVSILSIAQDVTERNRLERALQVSEAKLSDIFNSVNAGIISYKLFAARDFEYEYCSKGCEIVFGYTQAELMANKALWMSRVHPEDRKTIAAALARIFSQGSGICDYRFYHKDGSLRWLSANYTARYDASADVWMAIGVSIDISDRKRTEQALKQSEEKYRRIVDTANEGIWVIDDRGNTTFVNPGMAQMLGYSVPEMIGQSMFAFMDREGQAIAAHYLEARRQGISEQHDFKFRCKDGSDLWCIIGTNPIFDETGQFIGALGMITDITDRKLTQELLQHRESTLRSFFNSAAIPMGIVELHNGDILHISDNWAAAQFFGKTLEGMQNQFASSLGVSPATIERWIAYYQEAARTQAPVRFEYLHTTAEGQRWLSGSVCSIAVSPTGYPRFSYIFEDITHRKQAEQMLELQAVITRNMAEGICLVRADNGIIVYANPKFEQMFGYDSGELNGQHVSIVNYGNESVSAEDVNQAIRSVVLQNGEFSYEVQNVKKDGTLFWCSATCSVFRHSDYGDVLVAVHQDITVAKRLEEVRKQAEEALRQQANYEHLVGQIVNQMRRSLDLDEILAVTVTEVRQLLNADRVLIFQLHEDGAGSVVEESVLPEYPVTEKMRWFDECLPSDCYEFYRQGKARIVSDVARDEWGSCLVEFMQEVRVKSKVVAPIVQTVEGSDRSRVWGLLIAHACSSYRQWQTIEADLLHRVTDQLAIAIQQSELYRKLQIELHERKQTEATLREAERRWRFLLDNVQLVVVGLDLAGAVNYVNPFFLKLTGYTESEALGKNWFETFVLPSERQHLHTIFSEMLTSKPHPYYQNFILTKSGEHRFIAWNNTLLRDSAGHIIGTVSIGEDITERQKIEQMKNEFISIVSHELRTPLTAIRASLGLLQTGIYEKKPDKLKRMIEIAAIDSERLVRLVNDILDLERLDSARAVLEKTTCKASDLIRQAVEAVQAIADRQQIAFDIHPTDIEVWAASDAIVQTLINLLSNAVKFSPVGSTITVSVEPQIDRALFQVRDRGRGIPADKLEAIFGRFQQVDASDSRDKGGTGLGLAICRSIIERHGGRIWAESSLGAGSTFFFTLSLQQEA